MTNPFDAAVLELLNGQSAAAEPSEPVDGDQLLHDISSFIARFLYCSGRQRTILALWVLHTYCYHAAQVTPYLSIRSAQKQSGKTLCLQLLQLLCDFPTLTAGFTASSLLRRMHGTATDTLLLDECQASVGTRARPKSPTLRAILIRGTHPDPEHLTITRDRRTFCPKAFAGNGQLPEDLADHSLPIILQSLDLSETQPSWSPARAGVECGEVEVPSTPAGPTIERFHLRWAGEAAHSLRRQLHSWSSRHLARLDEMPAFGDEDFPPTLSPRQQDLAEPLLQLAALIGGEWPARIREALVGIFAEQTTFELQSSIQLLADIRDCFAYHAYPERLPTSVLLDWVHALPSRPWDIDGRFSAHTLARLLAPFQIRPRFHRMGKTAARGYQLQDFKEPWKQRLDFAAPPSVITHEESEIIRNGAVCSTVSLGEEVAVPAHNPVTRCTDNPISNPASNLTPADGFHRLSRLHRELGLKGYCPDLEAVANMYPPHSLHATLEWVDAHPEWSEGLKTRSALEFITSFQKTLALLQGQIPD